MDLAIVVGASILVLLTALGATALLRPPSPIDAAVTAGLVASAEVALLVGLPGALGHLRPGVVLAVDAAVAATVVLLAWRRRARLPLVRLRLADAFRHPWVTAAALAAGAGLAWQAVVAAVLPVYSYDGLTYHGATLAVWMQRGDLTSDPAVNTCCSHYPNNAELPTAFLAVLHGSDAYVDLVQLPFALLAAAAVAGIARASGASRSSSAAAAALFVMTPVVLAQTSTTYVDVIVAAWALAGIHALVRFAHGRDVRHVLTLGIAAGLLAGTKGTGILWAGAIAGGAVAVALWSRNRGWSTSRDAFRAIGVLAVTVGALGSFWYVRNWVDTGNPLYPFRVEVAGVHVFDGPLEVADHVVPPDGGEDEHPLESVAKAWAADLAVWRQGAYDYQQRAGGLGPLWPWLGLPLLAPLSWWLLRRRSPALLAVALVGAVAVLQPFRWWSRFTIPLAALGAVAVVVSADRVTRRGVAAGIRSLALVLAGSGVVLTSYELDPASRAPSLGAVEVLELVGAPAEERSIGRLFFPEYRFLEEVPLDATVDVDVAADAVRFVYPLYGPSWTRRVRAAEPVLARDARWVLTAAGRPLDRRLAADDRYELVSDERDVRVWRRH